MRAISWARGATCALASVLLLSPARADRAKSVTSCASFAQREEGDAKVAFTIRNACAMPLDCTVSWQVTCAPESKKRRAVHADRTKLTLPEGTAASAEASAAACGADGWVIDAVQWSCQPAKE
ncbi:MAG TPA: hypothetical protein VFP84_15830 [Kofleriaceae bacterium]|nr:hypothetical protein [Kofleriaceae bacterium]